jgi:hypothetical protein
MGTNFSQKLPPASVSKLNAQDTVMLSGINSTKLNLKFFALVTSVNGTEEVLKHVN